MTLETTTRIETVARLTDLLRRVAAETLADDIELNDTVTLKSVRITSLTMRAYLAAVEQEFGVEWDIDTPDEVFTSFGTLADHLATAAK